jgi:outer membrane protein
MLRSLYLRPIRPRGARTPACRVGTPADAWFRQTRRDESRRGTQECVRHTTILGLLLCAAIHAQSLPTLTLKDAEAMALQNHPQIQAAQHEAFYAGQQITINRAPLYPQITGDLTGSQANSLARAGAGDLAASRLFDRFGQGVMVQQLITDSGRTPNLIASSRLQAQAADKDLQTTRYGVLLQVNRAYFNVLRAQGVAKVAAQTVAARQLLDDQVTELAKNGLRSQVDVSFADVNVSQAKLLLLGAQEGVEQAMAELGAALGSDQPANFQLADEPLPAGPPDKADDLIAQAVANRPELASLKLARDAAYKFADAEKDLSRPTVNAAAVAGFLPLINSPGTPAEYESIAANVSIPLFNGHLFAARRAAAGERAMESDQKLRDQQERIFRDVRVAWAGAITAYQRIDVTAQFMRQAALALDLAKGRYDLQLASIVELTQAQLNVTEAEIENLSAKYDYQSQYSLLQYTIGLLR